MQLYDDMLHALLSEDDWAEQVYSDMNEWIEARI